MGFPAAEPDLPAAGARCIIGIRIGRLVIAEPAAGKHRPENNFRTANGQAEVVPEPHRRVGKDESIYRFLGHYSSW